MSILQPTDTFNVVPHGLQAVLNRSQATILQYLSNFHKKVNPRLRTSWLYQIDENGDLYIHIPEKFIAKQTEYGRSTISRIVHVLETKGYLKIKTFHYKGSDRNYYHFTFTKKSETAPVDKSVEKPVDNFKWNSIGGLLLGETQAKMASPKLAENSPFPVEDGCEAAKSLSVHFGQCNHNNIYINTNTNKEGSDSLRPPHSEVLKKEAPISGQTSKAYKEEDPRPLRVTPKPYDNPAMIAALMKVTPKTGLDSSAKDTSHADTPLESPEMGSRQKTLPSHEELPITATKAEKRHVFAMGENSKKNLAYRMKEKISQTYLPDNLKELYKQLQNALGYEGPLFVNTYLHSGKLKFYPSLTSCGYICEIKDEFSRLMFYKKYGDIFRKLHIQIK